MRLALMGRCETVCHMLSDVAIPAMIEDSYDGRRKV